MYSLSFFMAFSLWVLISDEAPVVASIVDFSKQFLPIIHMHHGFGSKDPLIKRLTRVITSFVDKAILYDFSQLTKPSPRFNSWGVGFFQLIDDLGLFLEPDFMQKSRKTFSLNPQPAFGSSGPLPEQLRGKNIQCINMQKKCLNSSRCLGRCASSNCDKMEPW